MMSSELQNKWLRMGDESEDDGAQGYDSEAREESRASHAPKRRRKLRDDDSFGLPLKAYSVAKYSSDDGETFPGDEEEETSPRRKYGKGSILDTEEMHLDREQPSGKHLHENGNKNSTSSSRNQSRAGKRVLAPLLQRAPQPSKTGVIYISRIPPFMKPRTLKSYLSPFGVIGRIFLTPEDPRSHRARVRSGGNKKRSFTDGWVEFWHKRDAKVVAESLNTQIIGGKKSSWYHDDVWNIKYLKGFKWSHLTEQIANENAERAARLRQEIGQTTKENKRFIRNVEKAKMLEGAKAAKIHKHDRVGNNKEKAAEPSRAGTPATTENEKFRKYFRQTEVRNKASTQPGHGIQRDEIQRVLSKIF